MQLNKIYKTNKINAFGIAFYKQTNKINRKYNCTTSTTSINHKFRFDKFEARNRPLCKYSPQHMKPTSELYKQSFRLLFYDEIWEYEQIISELSKKLKLDKNSNAFNNLGVAYFEIGEFENAFENLNSAIELNKKNAVAYINRADLNKKWKKITDAEDDYGMAIKLNPKDASYWRCRAYLRKENGDYEQALSDFKQAKRIDSKFEPTKKEIAELEQTLGIEKKSWIKRLMGK